MTSQECLNILDSMVEKVGNDEEIESLTADLLSVKDFVLNVDSIISTLNEDVEQLNQKNVQLRASNNTLYRQIGQQDEIMKKAQEEMSMASAINELF
jgi:cell division protein FtsB